MRLINTRDHSLVNFQGPVPRYAALSHRWGEDEVSFKEFKDFRSLYNLMRGYDKRRYRKILKFCDVARSHGLDWAWVDTCCIDQSSSAELSETINSMFTWYRQSDLCCVYLNDVRGRDMSSFQKSQWFSRGWTLQELLAPIQKFYFYDYEWNCLGTRSDLVLYISAASNIPAAVIYNQALYPIDSYSIAQRMSWASRRQTKRPEDIAYCLLGIFSINMPLLYGEGRVAVYHRLQLEIIKVYDDETVYAWSGDVISTQESTSGQVSTHCKKYGEDIYAILADHPSLFQADARTVYGGWKIDSRAFEATNRGIKLKATLYQDPKWLSRASTALWNFHEMDLAILPLRCERDGQPRALVVAKMYGHPDLFARAGIATLRSTFPKTYSPPRKIYLIFKVFYRDQKIHSTTEVLQDLRIELRKEISMNFRVTHPTRMPDLFMMHFDYFMLEEGEIKAVFRSSNTIRNSDLSPDPFSWREAHIDEKILTMDQFRSCLLRANISASWITEFITRLEERL